MSHRRAGAVLAGFCLALCALVGGCQSSAPFGSVLARHGSGAADLKTAAAPFVLAPGMEVEWRVTTVRATPNQINSGRSLVGPDGAIEFGPYGSCRIAGLPMAKASVALEKHLAKYLNHPAVTVTPLAVAPAPEQVAWRKAAPPAPGRRDGPMLVSFQTTGEKKEVETIGPPKLLIPPGTTVAPPIFAAAPPAVPYASECKPALLPPYVIGPTDVLLIDSLLELKTQPVRGPHLVGPDGSVRIGAYGAAIVAGLTLDQARGAIAQVIHARLRKKEADAKDEGYTLDEVLKGVSLDVLAYNSKQFFIVADGGGQGDQVIALPITGNDYVLNAMAKIQGLPIIASKHHIWVARMTCPGCPETRLPVDWIGITKRGESITNWQLQPGDRLYIQADAVYAADRILAKWLAPIERVFGGMLLGSQTVNSIKSGSVSGTR